jgi:hypothetical protein
VGGTPIQTTAVIPDQDGTVPTFAHGQIDGPGGARHQRDQGRLVALPDDPQDPVAALYAHVLDVGLARLGHPQAVQAQQHGQGGVGVIEALRGVQESGQLAAIQAPPLTRVDLGPADIRAGLDGMRPSMWAKR